MKNKKRRGIRNILFISTIFIISVILVFILIDRNQRFKVPERSLETKVEPILNREYFPCAKRLISEARKDIKVIMFEMRFYQKYPDSPSNQLIKGLISACHRNVEVEVILEQSEGYLEDNSHANQEVGLLLARSGVKVYLDAPKEITHSKLLIIDGKKILLGSTNWAYYSRDKNNEVKLLIGAEKVASIFIDYFERLKRKSTVSIIPE